MLIRLKKDSQSFQTIIYVDTLSAGTELGRDSTK